MPKTRIMLPSRRTISQRVKFKMGGRKSAKRGLDMTTEELQEIASDKNAGKKRQVASVILAKRGVNTLTTSEETA